MERSKKPVRSSSHRKEDKSKRAFEELIEPFFVTGWNSKDYGIDAVVEITTNNHGLSDVELESKCFLMQLKSTDKITHIGSMISYSVPTKKISYWYQYNLPVLFVLYDIQNDCFYYEWIGESLIANLDTQNPNWSNQKTITIKISELNKIESTTKEDIKKYVQKWKMPSRKNIEAGKYFELKDRGHLYIQEYRTLSDYFEFNSINETIKNIENDLDQSIYRIALTGLSRVGKSSLINALLKKQVSPTGFYQTTGVPIQVIPGNEAKINVYFQDGTNLSLPFLPESIKEYASQDYNEDNKKQVRLVSISIKNQSLERGVSLFDIPGLDDPNDDILAYTWQTVRKANAIIYVIDASPAEDGGYIFKNEYKKHITSFSQSQDKVFLVFNKVDRLSPQTLLMLKQRVVNDLKKHGLFESIGHRIFYISAENKVHDANIDSVALLNDTLWDFILSENKFGIIKLNLINQEIFKSLKSFKQILKTRLVDNEKRLLVEKSIAEVKARIPSLQSSFKERRSVSKELLMNSLNTKKHAILMNLEKTLKSIPAQNELLKSNQIKKYLIDSLNQAIDQSNNEYVLQVNQLKSFIDSWIEDNLKQLKEILSDDTESKFIDFTELETFEAPQIDFSSAWGMGFIGLLTGLLISAVPGAALIGGLVGFLGDLFTNSESRRVKQISKIMDTSRERYELAFEKIRIAFIDLIDDHTRAIDIYFRKQLQFYFEDLQTQLKKIDKPINENEMNLYDDAFKQIDILQSKLIDFDAELRSYHFTN